MVKLLGVGVITVLLLLASLSQATERNSNETARSTSTASADTRVVLSENQRIRAAYWQLSPEEWQRYRSLMDGIRGSVSPATLSPLEALGIHARDDAERRRYAEQWAVMMREDAERILAFQHAYDEVGRRLFPDESLIDLGRLPGRTTSPETLRRTDRVLLFLRPDCGACETLLARALARIDRVSGIDVFLAGIQVGDDAAIRAWAVDRGIPPEWVNQQRVTLNFEGGVLERVAPGRDELPMLFRRRGDSVVPLARSAL